MDVEKLASSYGTFLYEDDTKTLERVVQREPDDTVWEPLLKALGVVGLIAGFAMLIVFAFWMGDV
jgi:hypothetical protein